MLKTPHIHKLTRRKIMRRFTISPGVALTPRLVRVLDSCDSCARFYTLCNSMESALHGGTSVASPPAVERVRDMVFRAMENREESRRVSRVKVWAAAFGSAAVVCLVVLLSTLGRQEHRAPLSTEAEYSPVGIVAKGGAGEELSMVGIRIFKVEKQGSIGGETPRLSRGDMITFTYTHAKGAPGFLALFGIQGSGEVIWYYPDFEEARSIHIRGDVVDEPLGDGFVLNMNHQPGWLRLVALFSTEPISVERIEDKVQELRSSGVDPKMLVPLNFDHREEGCTEHSLLIEIKEANR